MTGLGHLGRIGGLAAVLTLHGGLVLAVLPDADAGPTGKPDTAPVLEAVLVEEPAPQPEPVADTIPPPDPAPEPPPPVEESPPPPSPPVEEPPPPPQPVEQPPTPPEPAVEPPPPPPQPAAPPPKAKPPTTPRPKAAPRPAKPAPAAPAAPAPTAPPPPAEPPRAAPQTIREPAAITCRAPAYPAESRRLGEAGTVELKLLIDTQGDVVDRHVEASSGFPRLDEAALDALSRCKFRPGTVDGREEKTWARLRYVWRLQ